MTLKPTALDLQRFGLGIISRGAERDYKHHIFYVGVYCLKCRRRWREAQVAAGFVNSRWWQCPNACNWTPRAFKPGQPKSW